MLPVCIRLAAFREIVFLSDYGDFGSVDDLLVDGLICGRLRVEGMLKLLVFRGDHPDRRGSGHNYRQ